MRPSSVTGLAATLVLLAGCNSSPTTADTRSPEQKRLDEVASQFTTEKTENKKPNELPLKFVDMSGNAVDLLSYRGKKNVVLVIVKGLPQKNNPTGGFCPGCLAQVNSLTASYSEFTSRNAEIVMVFPGPPEEHRRFLRDGLVTDADGKSKVPFPLVSDPNPDLKAVKTLGIKGDWARPSTYILNTAGDVVFAYVGPEGATYDRPPVKALLDRLEKLNGAP